MMLTALLALALSAEPAVVVASPDVNPARKTGGVIAPAVMPGGSTSLYAMLGAPELIGGYRQGFQAFELEARASFNYLLASFAAEAGVRIPIFNKNDVQMAPTVGLGLEFNSGARYFDKANFGYVALRPRLGFVTSIKLTEILSALVLFDLPFSIPLGQYGTHVVPTFGGGVELALGSNISGLVAATVGMDVIKEPLGVTQVRAGWSIKLGVGFRLF